MSISETCTCVNDSGFPYFPEYDSESVYADHMASVLNVVESWLYTQAFYKKKYCIIPEDLCEVYWKESVGITTLYFDLLNNLVGKKIKKLISKR